MFPSSSSSSSPVIGSYRRGGVPPSVVENSPGLSPPVGVEASLPDDMALISKKQKGLSKEKYGS